MVEYKMREPSVNGDSLRRLVDGHGCVYTVYEPDSVDVRLDGEWTRI
jgi:hypothetical protein